MTTDRQRAARNLARLERKRGKRGISMLDHFAGQILGSTDWTSDGMTWDEVAEHCYDGAEEMMAERERRMGGAT